MANAVATAAKKSEFLCFVQNKAKILPFNDLVDICTDFYKWEEIAIARNMLSDLLSTYLTKHKNKLEYKKAKATVIDIVRKMLDPVSNLPTFYASNLDCLPLLVWNI